MNANEPGIHISDIRTFRQCRRKWEWSSPLKRNLEPYIVYPPFFTGRAIHKALEMHYKNNADLIGALDDFIIKERAEMNEQGELWPQELDTLEEQITLAHNMLQHYSMWQTVDEKKYSDKNLVYIDLEIPFRVTMPTPAGGYSRIMCLEGRLDGFVYNTLTEEYWVFETKTTRSISELTNGLSNDEQSALYMYAAEKIFKKPITGVLYNVLRKKDPVSPRLLQNGLLSKADIDTTSFFYLNEIKRTYPDWSMETINEYFGDILANLQEREYNYFVRYPVYKTQLEIRNVLTGIYQTAREMLNPRTPLYPSPNWLSCNFCHFRGPCLAKNMGGDFEVLLKEEYKQRVTEEVANED